MQRQQTKRVLATVLFTDIVGSTMVAEELGDQRWRELLSRHHQIARRELKNFGGRELDTAGDGLFASFEQPAAAVRCAAAMARAMQSLGIDIRAGVHVGECEQIGNKLGGIAVHTGSRVMSLGNAAEVLVSGTTHDLVAGSRITFSDRGVHQLKGIEGEHRIWQVTSVDEAEVPSPLPTAEALERRAAASPPALLQRRWPRLALIGAALGLIGLLAYFVILPGDNGLSSIPPDNVGVIDPDAGTIRSAFPVGSGPGAVVASGDKAWIARRDARIVTVVDRKDGNTNTIAVEGSPTAMSLDQGHLWVLNRFEGTLVQIDTSTNQLTSGTIDLGTGVSDVAAGEGTVWVTNSSGHEVIPIDERTATESGDRVALSADVEPVAVTVGGGSVWVAGGKSLIRLDSETGDVEETLTLSYEVTDLVYGAGDIWALHSSDDIVTRVRFDSDDPSNVQQSATIEVGDGPSSIVVDDASAWVANQTSGTISQIDTATNAVVSSLDVGSVPVGIAEADGWVWVTAQNR